MVREGVNARTLSAMDVPEPCSLATMDVSFISVLTTSIPEIATAIILTVVLALASCSDPGSGAVPGAETGDADTPPTGALRANLALAVRHVRGDIEKRRALVARCRAALPDYLFGMIAQAALLLEDEEYDAFRELWGGRFDLPRD